MSPRSETRRVGREGLRSTSPTLRVVDLVWVAGNANNGASVTQYVLDYQLDVRRDTMA